MCGQRRDGFSHTLAPSLPPTPATRKRPGPRGNGRCGNWGVGPAASETAQKSFKCPPCCPWRTEPTVGSGASEKNSPRESDRDPGLPPAPLATPFIRAGAIRTSEKTEINRTETSMKAPLDTVVDLRRSDRFISTLEL